MRRKKIELNSNGSTKIFKNNTIKITKEDNLYFFEIGKELTDDIGEAVSILMTKYDDNHPLWDITYENVENITPGKSLFWLSGGYNEWRLLENYNTPWSECNSIFTEEYSELITQIIKRSKSLREIKDNFIKYLNLPILYDFALGKNLIKQF